MKLIELAKVYTCKIVTNDFNLNKVAQLHGVEVLNINELANALKPIVLPGETMRVFILKEGKEYNQGVAYLDDGTMVVVDNAKKMISRTIDITVTSVLQTTAGKMIFGRFDDRVHSVHEKMAAPADRHERTREAPAPRRRGAWFRHRRRWVIHCHEGFRHLAGSGTRHPHGPLRSREGRHQPQAVHAAGGLADPAAYHPQVRLVPGCHRDRRGAARGRYGVGPRALILEESFSKPVRLVEGGDSRQNSVENALASLDPDHGPGRRP